MANVQVYRYGKNYLDKAIMKSFLECFGATLKSINLGGTKIGHWSFKLILLSDLPQINSMNLNDCLWSIEDPIILSDE